MNINDQMNQLGQVGGIGYSANDAAVDGLVRRTRSARGRRQIVAGLIGSVGAVALGIVGAQLFANIDEEDAGMRDRAIDNDYAFLDVAWSERYGEDYTGLGATQDDLNKAWDELQAGALVKPEVVSPVEEPKVESTSCSYEEKTVDGWVKIKSPETGCQWKKDHQVETPEIPAGSFLFGNGHVYVCGTWTDAATGTVSRGAWSGTDWGWEKKAIICNPSDPYWYSYKYMGDDATWSGNTCVGDIIEHLGAPHQLSCLEGTYKVMNNSAYGWSTAHGWYYLKTSPPAGYEWNGSDFVPIPEPTPSPTGPTL